MFDAFVRPKLPVITTRINPVQALLEFPNNGPEYNLSKELETLTYWKYKEPMVLPNMPIEYYKHEFEKSFKEFVVQHADQNSKQIAKNLNFEYTWFKHSEDDEDNLLVYSEVGDINNPEIYELDYAFSIKNKKHKEVVIAIYSLLSHMIKSEPNDQHVFWAYECMWIEENKKAAYKKSMNKLDYYTSELKNAISKAPSIIENAEDDGEDAYSVVVYYGKQLLEVWNKYSKSDWNSFYLSNYSLCPDDYLRENDCPLTIHEMVLFLTNINSKQGNFLWENINTQYHASGFYGAFAHMIINKKNIINNCIYLDMLQDVLRFLQNNRLNENVKLVCGKAF